MMNQVGDLWFEQLNCHGSRIKNGQFNVKTASPFENLHGGEKSDNNKCSIVNTVTIYQNLNIISTFQDNIPFEKCP